MATDDSLTGDRVAIYFAPADALGADITDGNSPTGVKYQSFISNFDDNGGEKQVDTVYTFSDTGIHGAISVEKPRDQKELTFDIEMRHNAKIVDFKKIERGEGVVGTAHDEKVGCIIIQQNDGAGNYYYQAYNNVDAVLFETKFSAEEEWKGTLKFKLNTADANGVSNLKDNNADFATDLTSWS